MKLHLDFETQSAAPIRDVGVGLYAIHPTTKVLCVGFAIDDKSPKVVKPDTFLKVLKKLNFDNRIQVCAHNAAFELAIWNRCATKLYGWPPLTVEQTDCTMARAYAMGLPGGLDDCSAALGIKKGKDTSGHRVMLKLSRPIPKVMKLGVVDFYSESDCPEDYQKLYRYCAQDIEVERFVDSRTRPLTAHEKKVWVLDQKINARGLGIDLSGAKLIDKLVAYEIERYDRAMQKITDGGVMTCTQHAAILRFLNEEFNLNLDSVDANSLRALLRRKNVPKVARQIALLRLQASKSSTAKIKRMLESENGGGRLWDLFQYHAASTGRWGGRRLQPQNLPRGKQEILEHVEEIFDVINRYAQ